jgi:hypothetical protein
MERRERKTRRKSVKCGKEQREQSRDRERRKLIDWNNKG